MRILLKPENINKIKKLLFGSKLSDGLLLAALIYLLLICVGFVFLLPILKIISSSLKPLNEILDPTVGFIPKSLYFENYKRAFQVLNLKSNLPKSVVTALLPAVCQTFMTMVTGYGFARFEFPGKKILFILMMAVFLIPPQVTMIPQFLTMKSYGLLSTIWSMVIPAFFAQGLKAPLFVLIFYQFFKLIPGSLEEAAEIDGASIYRVFFTVAIPMAVPSIIVAFIFSLVWYWNETTLTALFLQAPGFENAVTFTTLPLELKNFSSAYEMMFPDGSLSVSRISEGISMAGMVITILPMLIIYFVLQRWFVEGVDRSGITGE